MAENHRTPFWKRKRWIAAAVLFSVPGLYIGGIGPANYCAVRGWVPMRLFQAAYGPAITFADNSLPTPVSAGIRHYRNWWVTLALGPGAFED